MYNHGTVIRKTVVVRDSSISLRGSAAGSLENPLIVSEVSLHAPHVLRIILAIDRIRP